MLRVHLPESAFTAPQFSRGTMAVVHFIPTLASWYCPSADSQHLQAWALSSQSGLMDNDIGELAEYVSCGKILPLKTQKKELHQIPWHFPFCFVCFLRCLIFAKIKAKVDGQLQCGGVGQLSALRALSYWSCLLMYVWVKKIGPVSTNTWPYIFLGANWQTIEWQKGL